MLRFVPGAFGIRVNDETNTLVDLTLNDVTYVNGGFGFYNYSQGNIRYTGFTRRSLPEATYLYDADALDPDFDPLTYGLIQGPAGMAINPLTGLIRWAPTAESLLGDAVSRATAALPVVPGFLVENYGNVSLPAQLAFDDLGNLYVGQDCPPSGPIPPLNVRRITPVTRSVSNFGPGLADPDAVLVDARGTISGVPGALLVGGEPIGILAILPDGSTRPLIGGVGNPQALRFDSAGRLLFINHQNHTVVAVEGGVASVLFNVPNNGVSLAIGPGDTLYYADGQGTIHLYDRDGHLLNGSFATGLGDSAPLALGPGGVWGRDLYTTGLTTGELLRINSDGVVRRGISMRP
jgi:hypothetical protein